VKVVVTGGTGFLGGALVNALRARGDEVVLLTRHATGHGEVQWSPGTLLGPWATAFEGASAVVNLAGAPIADGRWTAKRKASILASRVEATRAVVAALRAAGAPGAVLLSGSAVGYYGTHRSDALDESSPPGHDFLADVCRQWEAEALAAREVARVVLLRTGFVVARDGGALPRLALPFHFFAGGPLGSGRQVMSWIHRDDWVAMVCWALTNAAVNGPLNLTAPAPVTNREMAAAVGRALHRPALVPAPSFALRLMLGEMADALILNGQRVLPRVALDGGFEFRFASLSDALAEIYGRES
jgi:uncharacterized protein (TIGR01777 family)